MNGVLVYSERPAVALELLTFAATLQQPVAAVLLNQETKTWTEAYLVHGAQCVYSGNDPSLSNLQADVLSEALVQIVNMAEADVILVGSTLRGREVAARLAQKLEAGCITDAINVRFEEERLIATRYSLGGNTLSERLITSPKQVIAVMPQTFQAEPSAQAEDSEVIEVALQLTPSPVKTIERHPKPAAGVDVESAEVVVCVGRGLDSEDDLEMVRELASALGGVVACSRPISHDRHWLPEDQMIGISGKKISPRLYFGIGLSGQIQHMVGVMGAKVIVAVNKDPNALIFKNADYGIVGDLYHVIPRLTGQINRWRTDSGG
jgi:electron transfer flavoprotein alpha subunit